MMRPDRRHEKPRRFPAPAVLAALVLVEAFARPLLAAPGYRLETVAANLHHPWSVALLPGGDFLVTERRGRLLRIARDGSRRVIGGVPDTYVAGQGGFFDVVLHPQFADESSSHRGRLYMSYAEGHADANGTAIYRARLDDDRLIDGERILRVRPDKDTPQHYGGRLAFLPDGTLLLTTGDGFDYREAAQDPRSELGKVLRIHDDGSVPDDNPFHEAGSERVWTLGHRNPQGLLVDAASGDVLLHEHGPRGGDELNSLTPGENYGWPAITYGIDYSGARISPFTEAPGMQQPLHQWTPSIAPSGLTRYRGSHFADWQGQLFVGALVDREVRMLRHEEGGVTAETALFEEPGARIRDVRMLEDGYLYLLTDSPEGQLLRVVPARH
jgi:glucose/arabinose dehydrogenase